MPLTLRTTWCWIGTQQDLCEGPQFTVSCLNRNHVQISNIQISYIPSVWWIQVWKEPAAHVSRTHADSNHTHPHLGMTCIQIKFEEKYIYAIEKYSHKLKNIILKIILSIFFNILGGFTSKNQLQVSTTSGAYFYFPKCTCLLHRSMCPVWKRRATTVWTTNATTQPFRLHNHTNVSNSEQLQLTTFSQPKFLSCPPSLPSQWAGKLQLTHLFSQSHSWQTNNCWAGTCMRTPAPGVNM